MDGLTDLTYCSMDVMSYTNANERTTLHWRRHGGLRKYGYGSLPTHKFEKKCRVNLHQIFKLRKSTYWLDSRRIADMNFLSQHGLFCNTLIVPRVVVKVVWCFAKQAVNRPLYHKWYNLALYNHVWTLPFFGIKKKGLKKNVKAPFFYEKRVLKSKVC